MDCYGWWVRGHPLRQLGAGLKGDGQYWLKI